jgi:tRNA(Ile)-lysidine synthase
LEKKNLPYFQDPSNEDERFVRNMVRLRLLPLMEKLNPAYLAAFGRAATLAAGEEEFWEQHLDGLLKRLDFKEDLGWYAVRGDNLTVLSLAERRRVFGRLMRLVCLDRTGGGEPISMAGVEKCLDFQQTPGAHGLDLPGGRRIEWRGQYLYVGPASRYNT